MFADDMSWLEDPIEAPILEMPLRTQQLALCIYAHHLWNDGSIFAKRITGGTIKKYVQDAAELLIKSSKDYKGDPRKDNQLGRAMGHHLSKLYSHIDKFENAPQRREAFTIPMLDEAIQRGKSAPWRDHMDEAMANWCVINLRCGNRKSEWAQPEEKNGNPDRPHLNRKKETYAFCLIDVKVKTRDGRELEGADMLSVPVSQILEVWIRYRMQKNGENGEWRMYASYPDCPDKCFCNNMYQIVQRFVRLRGADDVHTPLALYKSSRFGDVKLITPKVIMTCMRNIAAKVHKMHPKKDKAKLRRWSSHSFRVGACVLLHERGYSQTQIKWMLRWKSDTFMMYLRNALSLAKKSADLLIEKPPMPDLLAPMET